ncbi:MAG: myo-inositol 2-dehydrogenase [Bacteroidetes bacterium GWA2_31_9b]|nr:MAG: myo-inositol 2-dehydrogenase [Bacteroidetes bacterium GWA2_31_9b]
MSNHINSPILLIGSGPMAVEYAKVLIALKTPFITIGRGEQSASMYKEKTGCEVITGGLLAYLNTKPLFPSFCIIATGVESLTETTKELLRVGVKNILCEKPGGLFRQELEDVCQLAQEKNATLLIAYNRRFYSSVYKAQEIIEQDGGVISFNFEFTEWAHLIEPLEKGAFVKERLFLSNSSHVADLAFYLGGKPKKLSCFTAGGLSWHPSASMFTGAGVSDRGALFSYNANWNAPGRWAVEILTANHRLYLKPMEKLQIQKKGSVVVEDVQIDNKLDTDFKPGLYRMVNEFCQKNNSKFCTIEEQLMVYDFYCQIANYEL